MKEYLLLFRGGDSEMTSQSPEQSQAHMQRWMQWMGELGKNLWAHNLWQKREKQ